MFGLLVATLLVVSPAICRETVTSTLTVVNTVTETITEYDETACLKYISATEMCKDRRNFRVDEFGAVQVQLIEPQPVRHLEITKMPETVDKPSRRGLLSRLPMLRSSKSNATPRPNGQWKRFLSLKNLRPKFTGKQRAPLASVISSMVQPPYTTTVTETMTSTVNPTLRSKRTKTVTYSGCVFTRHADQICPP